MIKKKLNLKEIAQELNVSPSTVSLVLHGNPGVSDITRAKVLKLLDANGHLEKKISKAVKDILLFKYSTIGYFPDKNDGLFSTIIDAIGSEAKELGFNILVNTCHEGELNKILCMPISGSFSGVIMIGTEFLSNVSCKPSFRDERMPAVLMDSNAPLYGVDRINIDNKFGVYTCLNHFFELGHKKIGYIHSNIVTSNYEERYNAFLSYFSNAEIDVEPPTIYHVTPSLNGAYEKILTIIKNGNELPTALLAANDTLAFGAMKAIKENGYQIPEDISIIGFDDNAFCKMSDPPLTTIRIPAEHMGKCAVRLLNDRIKDSGFPDTGISLNGELVLRESTGPPRMK